MVLSMTWLIPRHPNILALRTSSFLYSSFKASWALPDSCNLKIFVALIWLPSEVQHCSPIWQALPIGGRYGYLYTHRWLTFWSVIITNFLPWHWKGYFLRLLFLTPDIDLLTQFFSLCHYLFMLNRAASIIAIDLYIQCTTPVIEEMLPKHLTY